MCRLLAEPHRSPASSSKMLIRDASSRPSPTSRTGRSVLPAPSSTTLCFHQIANHSIRQSLHWFLLQLYPKGDPGHTAIKSWSYLLHNSTTREDILPSSPCVKPLRDLIGREDWVQMSIIFQVSDVEAASLEGTCPACGTMWTDTSAVNVTWFVGPFLSNRLG